MKKYRTVAVVLAVILSLLVLSACSVKKDTLKELHAQEKIKDEHQAEIKDSENINLDTKEASAKAIAMVKACPFIFGRHVDKHSKEEGENAKRMAISKAYELIEDGTIEELVEITIFGEFSPNGYSIKFIDSADGKEEQYIMPVVIDLEAYYQGTKNGTDK